ncbi:MAG: class I SAM-dependent methyltransferase [Nanoarchaeales archaeon]|nr:class I SAM-dependent methyltransferase [Nanoarchaeales archaeon]
MEKDYNKINEETYNKIFENWETKRSYFWKPVVDFVESFSNKNISKLQFLDLGCGGGRHLQLAEQIGFSKSNLIGSDISSGQLKTVTSKGFIAVQCDFTSIPLDTDSFDAIVCIAAFHHLLDKNLQQKALLEFKRILNKNGGRILISNWFPEKEYVKKQIEKKKFNFDQGDDKKVRVTYFLDGERLDRYYYLFDEDELDNLLRDAGFKIISKEHFRGNLYHILE